VLVYFQGRVYVRGEFPATKKGILFSTEKEMHILGSKDKSHKKKEREKREKALVQKKVATFLRHEKKSRTYKTL